MRRAAVLLLCAALAGCGGGSEREAPGSQPTPDPALVERGSGPAPERPAPPERDVDPAVQERLDAGEPGVVDLTGAVGVRPRTIEFAEDAVLRGIRWSRWDAGGAEGRGTLRTLTCNPTCASGRTREQEATIELSAPRPCTAGRFFSASEVTPASGPAPASYLRPPC